LVQRLVQRLVPAVAVVPLRPVTVRSARLEGLEGLEE